MKPISPDALKDVVPNDEYDAYNIHTGQIFKVIPRSSSSSQYITLYEGRSPKLVIVHRLLFKELFVSLHEV